MIELLSPGDVVGRFHVQRRIGVGGMAEVWSVLHNRLGTTHALKVLLHPTPELARRLRAEARAQLRLRHPHVVPVTAIVDVNGSPGLLMPLITGPTLSAVGRGQLPQAQALAIFVGIVAGVQAAHDRGYVHRDLKPANVLLDVASGTVVPRVADFGLVKHHAASLMTAHGVFMGTPAYAAPEQLADAAVVDRRADLFSLGVMLVELLTGRRPFAGHGVAEVMAAHRNGPRIDGLPEPMRSLSERLMSLSAEGRPADCAELLEALGPQDVSSLGALAAALAPAANTLEEATLPPRGQDVVPSALPVRRDVFIERSELQAQLQTTLDHGHRPVTLVGPAGTGKTRFALEFCRAHPERFPGGVQWIEVERARTEDELLRATADGLGVALGRQDPSAQVQMSLSALAAGAVIDPTRSDRNGHRRPPRRADPDRHGSQGARRRSRM